MSPEQVMQEQLRIMYPDQADTLMVAVQELVARYQDKSPAEVISG